MAAAIVDLVEELDEGTQKEAATKLLGCKPACNIDQLRGVTGVQN